MASTIPRLSLIKTKHDLAVALGIPKGLITRRAFQVNQTGLYHQMAVRKRSGGMRTIHAPFWPMLNIQRRILLLLEEIYKPPSRVMGFVKGRGIRKNATFHVGKQSILNVDIQDYFSAIHLGRIRGRLMAPPYNLTDDVATTIAKLCTLNGVLPTGAPTSPILANMITSSLDGELTKFARTNGCFYTRYADDITFSTNLRSFPPSMISQSDGPVRQIVAAEELSSFFDGARLPLNPTKTRVLDRTMRHEICGVTCNERLNVRWTLIREVRGAVNAWRKYGRIAADEAWNKKYNWREAKSLERSLRGRTEHIIHIKGLNDAATANIVTQFNELSDRHFNDISYTYTPANPLGILNSVCLILCEDDDAVVYGQGSGFVIESGAVITNHHAITYLPEDKYLPQNSVPFPVINVSFDNPPISYPMRIVYSDSKRDIAVLRCADPFFRPVFERLGCSLNLKELSLGTKVSHEGYPNYQSGDTCRVFPGNVTGTGSDNGQKFFNVSQPVVKGEQWRSGF